MLHIMGSSFSPNEIVSLTITIETIPSTNTEVATETTKADGTGHIVFYYSGSGGGVCNDIQIRTFSVQGTGQTSHKVSNTVQTGCP